MKMKNQCGSCRVVIIGAQQIRVAKVTSILLQNDGNGANDNCDNARAAKIEYLPCVATFDQYQDADGSSMIRYLASLEYHGADGRSKGSSLAPFFDGGDDDGDVAEARFPAVAGLVIGCGIETEFDMQQIEQFVKNFSSQDGGDGDEEPSTPIVIKCLQPNEEFSSMKDETRAYRGMSKEEKADVTQMKTMGPGKMAAFARNLAERIVSDLTSSTKSALPEPLPTTTLDDKDIGVTTTDHAQILEPSIEKKRYACRGCRSVLFGADDLLDHMGSQQSFSYRKIRHAGAASSGVCQSHFLAKPVEWMGDTGAPEGKFNCPFCRLKLGQWKWQGAQCSCGSWVTPAIQVPISRVDTIQSTKHLTVTGLVE